MYTCVSAGTPGGGEVCYALDDFMCLNPGKAMNDDAMEFFMSQLAHKYDVLCMSPRFYSCLTNPQSGQVPEPEDASSFVRESNSLISYGRVKNWYTSVFTNDLVFIPVVNRHHWSLFVVCYPWATAELADPSSKKRHDPDACGPLMTTILAFDSYSTLKRNYENLAKPIRDYLTMQWLRESGGNEVDFSAVPLVRMHTPQQRNDVDCGLFVLRMCEEVAKNVPSHDLCRAFANRSVLQKMYVRAFSYKGMRKYRCELKRQVKLVSKEQARWLETWDALF